METAIREYLQISRPSLLRLPKLTEASVVYSARVSIDALLDLADQGTRRKLGTNLAELSSPWRYRRDRLKPPTQRLGAVAAALGRIQAIQFLSTKGPGACVVIFTDNLGSSAYVEVNDPGGKLIERIP
jgi:hypothetical protein